MSFPFVFETTNRKLIIVELENLLYSKWQQRNELCQCNSGKKFKRCHLEKWNTIMKSGREYVIEKLEILKECNGRNTIEDIIKKHLEVMDKYDPKGGIKLIVDESKIKLSQLKLFASFLLKES